MSIDLSAIPPPPVENEPLAPARASIETLALLARRRSTPIALMTGPGPSRAEIETLIRLAARVPDHGKLGPWRFVIYEGPARRAAGEKLAALVARRKPEADGAHLEMEAARFERAPVVIAVISTAALHPKIPEWEQVLSAGAVCFQLLLAAYAMDYAGAWLTEWPAYDAEARTLLGLADHERIAGFVYLGAAKENPLERVRPPLAPRIAWA